MHLELEDTWEDVVNKAARGLGKELGPLPQTEEDIRALARQLGLHPGALADIARGRWKPSPPPPFEGLMMFTTDFGPMRVNSYLVFDPGTREAAAFDTGADGSGMLETGLPIRHIFLTHAHGDHVFDLDRLMEKTGAAAWSSVREPVEGTQTFEDGACFRVGALEVEARRASGHARGGTAYYVRGLARPVVIAGDALFAGSMGGAAAAYREALETARASIFSLPEDTVICPGHGPLTTVGQERRHNPFFAG